jgi:hypothetical protein
MPNCIFHNAKQVNIEFTDSFKLVRQNSFIILAPGAWALKERFLSVTLATNSRIGYAHDFGART